MPLSINICRSTNCQRPTYKQTNKQKGIKKQETNSRKKKPKIIYGKVNCASAISFARCGWKHYVDYPAKPTTKATTTHSHTHTENNEI